MNTANSEYLERTRAEVWALATHIRDEAKWMREVTVDLDRDPTKNIGGLHEKIQEIQQHANKVRVGLYDAIGIRATLRTLSSIAEAEYEKAFFQQQQSAALDEDFKKIKTKEEREVFVRARVVREYDLKATLERESAEWDQVIKQMELVYNRLAESRRGVDMQIATIKQQMFKGEIDPNPKLEKLGAIADIVGADTAAFLAGAAGVEPDATPEVTVPGVTGEVEW